MSLVVARGWRWEKWIKRQGGTRELTEVIEMHYLVIVFVAIQLYIFIKTHLTVILK